MSERISLKEAERRAFTTRFQDGLWDILVGCILLLFAIAPFLSEMGLGDFWSSAIFVPFWALAYLIIHMLRKYVVIPRTGVVRFGPARRTRLLWLNALLLVILLAGLVLSLFWADTAGMPRWMPVPPIVMALALIMLVGSSAAAYLLDFNRLYLYGLLAALSPLVGEWLYVRAGVVYHGYPITFGFAAGVAIVSGVLRFIRFVRENPIPKPEPVEQT